MESAWVSLSDAAFLLRMSYHRAMRLVLIGALEAERQDGRWRISRTSVHQYLKEVKGSKAITA